jgi:YVTN family beta-propeller protein
VSRRRKTSSLLLTAVAATLLLGACGGSSTGSSGKAPGASASLPAPAGSGTATVAAPPTTDLYAADAVGHFSPATEGAKTLVYVPNTGSNTISVIDPATFKVIDTFPVGREPQHVVPSWDLTTLYSTNDLGNSLTAIDPKTGKPIKTIPVADPYNMYFTPDGRYAIVMAEAQQAIDFRDPHTFALVHRLSLGPKCAGVDHADFSADGSYMIATCEFAGRLVKINLKTQSVVGYVDLGRSAGPQDIKIDPQGKTWYVADFNRNGVWEISGDPFKVTGFLPTGPETHGLYPSRDGKYLYVSNRGGTLVPGTLNDHVGDDGSVSVVSFATKKVVATWPIPGGGTPDMGNVSADGTQLWLSGRRSNVVYVFDTANGKLLAKIPVGIGPHGLCFWPEPGDYSLGHTGILR